MTASLVIDTDIGGEPDDAMALAIAAHRCPELALVLTTDEADGQRARLARWFLDLLGRPDVPVVAGRRLSSTPYFWVADLIPGDVADQPSGPVGAVAAVCERTSGPVRWLGLGPMSNLGDVLDARPDLAHRLVVTQMGGALAYRDPAQSQYNFRLDPVAVRTALDAVSRPRLVTYDVTFAPRIAITADSPLYRRLAGSSVPWAAALVAQCDRYYAGYHPATIPHTPLALSAALGEPFVRFDARQVAVDKIGRTTLADDGTLVQLSTDADHSGFAEWLYRELSPAIPRPVAPVL
ncbi:nucleoside hydrolase [Micromonospora sp. NPDC023814]|uniref:nucleoside hydrolase n=1 Tax=Micromonospora sp. NPDC023814 TaxID=3154596 RepID=UPI0033C54529